LSSWLPDFKDLNEIAEDRVLRLQDRSIADWRQGYQPVKEELEMESTGLAVHKTVVHDDKMKKKKIKSPIVNVNH
jgi:hypothetical protein